MVGSLYIFVWLYVLFLATYYVSIFIEYNSNFIENYSNFIEYKSKGYWIICIDEYNEFETLEHIIIGIKLDRISIVAVVWHSVRNTAFFLYHKKNAWYEHWLSLLCVKFNQN